MKKSVVKYLLIATAILFLSACGLKESNIAKNENKEDYFAVQNTDGDSFKKDESTEKSDNVSVEMNNTKKNANWTVSEGIENNMRYTGGSLYCLYAEGSTLFAAHNAVHDRFNLDRYAGLVADKGASPQILQIKNKKNGEAVFLDSNGRLWFAYSVFEGYDIRYFDFSEPDSPYGSILAGVTADGKVVYCNASDAMGGVYGQKAAVKEIEGVENVKYISAYYKNIVVVRNDGTAAYINVSNDSITELDGWTDMAMVYVNGEPFKYTELIGLKKDGTIVAQALEGTPVYPDEILSWTDIVHIIRSNDFVAGLKADGSFVYAVEKDADEKRKEQCAETFGTWTNVMVADTRGAITADRKLLGEAKELSFGWDLENPYQGSDAAWLEGEYVDSNRRKNLSELPIIQ